jgi:mono/diheme cytochrome c family protein
MRRLGTLVVVLVGIGGPIATAGRAQAPAAQVREVSREQTPAVAAKTRASARETLDKYCVSCHNQRLKVAGLTLDTLDLAHVGSAASIWEKVATKIRTHEMPPAGRPRPDSATYAATASELETALDNAAAAKPNPGRVAVHRLNRVEYANSIRDLLALQIDSRSLLPSDDSNQESFDNIASVLSVSPVLLEGYLSAASRVSRLAVGDTAMAPLVETYQIPKSLAQDDRTREDLPFGSQGGTVIRHHFPVDAEYTVKVSLRRELYYYIIGMGDPHQIEIRLDGTLIKRFNIGGEARGRASAESFIGQNQGDPEWEVYMQTADAGLEVRLPVKAGTREVGISFVRQYYEPTGMLQPPQHGFARATNELYHGHPAVDTISIGGPHSIVGAGDTPSRRRVFVCHPKDSAAEEPCAKQILTTLARRAYRRPVTERDLGRLLNSYKEGRAEGDFALGIRYGLERVLASPSFLFRIEEEPANAPEGTPYRLSDLDIASRLSFFLWSSIPDDELLDVAIRGKLREQAVLARQVRRMLADSRSQALVDNFATQWLSLGKLAGIVPDVDVYPEFDENLREAMQEETRRFIGSQLREDRSVIELLTANYTFVNERLAQHYGIPHVYGNHFRRVTFTDGKRGGLLGHASTLTATSYPNRTSPVLRGKWILANLLGGPPPPPPADVPPLREAGEEGQPRSVRERLEEHRKNPACASCHRRMDPLGFSLENFDGVGKWRTISDGAPIDTTAVLPDGAQLQGLSGLRTLIASHPQEFVRTLGEKLLSYAIGRVIEPYDLPAVRKVARESATQNYRWSSLVEAIVTSTPFTMGIVEGKESRNGQPVTGVASQ